MQLIIRDLIYRSPFIWLRRVTVYFHVFVEIAISVKRLNKIDSFNDIYYFYK